MNRGATTNSAELEAAADTVAVDRAGITKTERLHVQPNRNRVNTYSYSSHLWPPMQLLQAVSCMHCGSVVQDVHMTLYVLTYVY